MKRDRVLLIVLVAATAACELQPTPEPPIGFWCDGLLCDWTREQGGVERAPTWHEHDYGIRLLDAPVVISRATTIDAELCTRFSLVGNVDAAAQLALELDVFAADPIEFQQVIPETRWEAQTFFVPPAEPPPQLTQPSFPASLRLHKRGPGEVVLARLEVERVRCDTRARVRIVSEPTR